MSREYWVTVSEDGKIFLHSENDGYAYLRKGADKDVVEVTLEQLKSRSYLYDQALKQLKEINE